MTDIRKETVDDILNRWTGRTPATWSDAARAVEELCFALRAQQARIEELEAERDANKYVPGVWYCQKCEFRLIQSNLNSADGTVTARDEPGEKCPNCHVPLWRVSWQNEYADLMKMADGLQDLLGAAEAERDALVAAACDGLINEAAGMADGADEAAYIERRLRACIPTDALASLEARDRRMKAEAEHAVNGVRSGALVERAATEAKLARAVEALERLAERASALSSAARLVDTQLEDGGVTEGAHAQMEEAISALEIPVAEARAALADVKGDSPQEAQD